MLTEITMPRRFEDLTKMIINLPNRKDRLEQITHDLRQAKLSSVFMVSPGIVDEVPFKGIGKAHLEAIGAGLKIKRPVLIMEDDCTFPGKEKTLPHINKCLENAPADWDILLGGLYSAERMRQENEYWDKVDGFTGFQFYIIRKKGFEKLEKYDYSDHIDKWISKNGFNIFVMRPFCAIQRDGYSDNVKRQTKYNERLLKKFSILK